MATESLNSMRGQLGRASIPLALLGAIVLFSVLRPEPFPTSTNFTAVVSTQAALLFIALAITIVLAAGDFDLSVGAVAGLSMTLVAVLTVQHGWAWPLAVAAALGMGLLVGLIQGGLIAFMGLNAFIVTLGSNTILIGLATGVSAGTTVGPVPEGLVEIATEKWLFNLPLFILYGLILTALIWYVFSHTPLGRYMVFVGDGPKTAKLAGLPVRGIKLGAFVCAALICALGGALYAGQLGAADPSVGPSLLLPAYAAAFLGATTITPGRFNAWGTFFSLYLVATCVTGLQLVGLPLWTESVFVGTILIAAIAFSKLTSRSTDAA
jgi:ribose transport system permease protein